MSISQWSCLVDDCTWVYEEDNAEPSGPLVFREGRTVEEAINEVVRQRVAKRETVMRNHLETHDVTEFASTIARLRHRVGCLGGPEEMAGTARVIRSR